VCVCARVCVRVCGDFAGSDISNQNLVFVNSGKVNSSEISHALRLGTVNLHVS
jgi:hypothetical protein